MSYRCVPSWALRQQLNTKLASEAVQCEGCWAAFSGLFLQLFILLEWQHAGTLALPHHMQFVGAVYINWSHTDTSHGNPWEWESSAGRHVVELLQSPFAATTANEATAWRAVHCTRVCNVSSMWRSTAALHTVQREVYLIRIRPAVRTGERSVARWVPDRWSICHAC